MLTETDRELTTREYQLFRDLVYEKSGINLGDQKQQLVRARLGKRLRAGNFRSYRDYYDFVRHDPTGNELCALLDAISTNTTHLFREKQHFDFLARALRERLAQPPRRGLGLTLRIWSAGCSTGDEPYSIAMTVDDTVGHQLDWRILATDLSTRVLDQARAGLYETHRLGTVPPMLRQRYFTRPDTPDRTRVQVCPALRDRIRYARFNLMSAQFPFRHGFDFIFCRNVMIYFDRPTQESLVAKFAHHLRPGGYLLIGHSESLNGLAHPLRYVQPTIYQRVAT
ncbi:MAG: protein-glutamate O-methyltransferase [Phycisphaerae bacterium]|nr:protein-glutamate O-methyltransferase [Phycisphaerae bacterium]